MESLRLQIFSFFFLPLFFHLSLSVTAVPVEPPSPSPSPLVLPPSAPPPTLGGIVSSAPAFPWPFRPHPREESLSPSPTLLPPASPYLLPEKGDGPIPFIVSNPVLPLPTGEVDSATIRPFPTSSAHGRRKIVHVSLVSALQLALCWKLL